MRLIVNLYRWIILLALFGVVGGAVLGGIAIANAGGMQNPMLYSYIIAMFIGFVFLVLTLGITATFISIHDRHAEIADELASMRIAIERHSSSF